MDRLLTVLNKVNGAFSIIALMDNKLVVARDPYGFRPLVIGQYEEGYAIASETCALDLIGATNIVDIQPGEVIIFDKEKKETFYLDKKVTKHFCIFEHIYFSRPDTVIDNQLVYEVRKRIGEELAKESYVD